MSNTIFISDWDRLIRYRSLFYGYTDTKFLLRGVRGLDGDFYTSGLRLRQRVECLPCPFCGSKDTLVTHDDGGDYGGDTYGVECQDCPGEIGCCEKSEIEAIEKWNRRVK
jgi:Lar family restriction alleviation protein